jgi:hypothetical protein
MSTTTDNEFVTSAGVLWDDPEEGRTWMVSLVGIVILCALVVFLSVVYFRTEQKEIDLKIVDESWLALQRSKQAQMELLSSAGAYTADVGGKPVARERMPIAKAMEALVANPALAVPPASRPAASADAAPAPAAPATDVATTGTRE